MTAFGVVGFVIVLTLVILVHETGHYWMARRFGMKVEEFFAGFGPRLWSFRRGETEYGIKAILLGGYVKIAGMNPYQDTPPEDVPRTFGAKPIWQRALTIFAGPSSHFVMAFLALFLWLAVFGQPVRYAAEIAAVLPEMNGTESPAAAAGLRVGDVIVSVDGQEVDADAFVALTRENTDGVPMTLVVDREGQRMTVVATPAMSNAQGERVPRFGVNLSQSSPVLERDRPNPVAAVGRAASMTWEATTQVLGSFGRIFGPEGIGRMVSLVFSDADRSIDDPVSVVGAANVTGQAAGAADWDLILVFFVSLNIFLGLVNLIPLPPFDGGHLAALAIEKVRGKPVDMRKMVPIGAVVFGLFLLFGLTLVYLDIVKPLDVTP